VLTCICAYAAGDRYISGWLNDKSERALLEVLHSNPPKMNETSLSMEASIFVVIVHGVSKILNLAWIASGALLKFES
jgi:hypothetical protein